MAENVYDALRVHILNRGAGGEAAAITATKSSW